MLTIDGGHLEAGGQIVRTAIGLSCVTGKPVKIFNIRKGRPVPGLKAQ
ncbi:MAG: RNA 3'-phosphate cyclase, partial [Candidatus Aenigmarchaeota archaeon]|nr:RNA 3'-phosphate cyclase [Candidatus Aenigmarchaeota archaeon]